MGRKILWLVVSGLMALSLLIAACAPAATPTAPTKPTTPATPTAPTAPVQEKAQQQPALIASAIQAAEKPKYGGTLTIAQTTWVNKFDIAVSAG